MTPRIARLARTLLLLVLLGPAGAAARQEFELPIEATRYAALSCEALLLGKDSVVDSRGLATGAALAGRGHVRSNGDVLLNAGYVEVHGDAVAGPGRKVRGGKPKALVTGAKRVASEPFECVPFRLDGLRRLLDAASDNRRIPRTDKMKRALGGPDGRGLELRENDGLTLPAGTYLLSALKLAPGARLRIEGDGRVEILVVGPIDVRGAIVHPDGNPFQLRIWSAGAIVKASAKAELNAFLYAPRAALAIGGEARWSGAVQAKKVAITGGARLLRVIDDVPPALSLDAPEDGERVESCTVDVAGVAMDHEGSVTVEVNDAPFSLDLDGAFSHPATASIDDPGRIEAVATDRSGNTTTLVRRVVADPPVVELTSHGLNALVGDRVVDLSGVATDAGRVTINGRLAKLDGAGGFRLADFDLGSGEGLLSLDISSRNCGGETRRTQWIDLDTLPPSVTIDSPHSGDRFANGPIRVAGAVSDAHLATVTVNGLTATVKAGRFVVSGVGLGPGSNKLIARARDLLGRESTSPAVEVDRQDGGVVVIEEPLAGAIVGSASVAVRGFVTDSGAYRVSINGVLAQLGAPSGDRVPFSAASVPLGEGVNRVFATADLAGGLSLVSPVVTVVRDSEAPRIAFDTLPALLSAASVSAAGTVSDAYLEAVSVNGVPATVSAGRFVAGPLPLLEGANLLVARAVDVVGNVAETPAAKVVRDSSPPTVYLEALAEPLVGATPVAVSGRVDEPHLEQLWVAGSAVTAAADGSFAASVPLVEGTNEIRATARDRLGHTSASAPIEVTLDSLAPALKLSKPLGGEVFTSGEIDVEGVASDAHLESVQVNGVTATVDAATGVFHLVVTVPAGPASLRVVATDRLGHLSETTVAIVVDIDQTSAAPVVTLDQPALPQGACLPAGAPQVLGGTFTDLDRTPGGAAPSVEVDVVATDGSRRSHAAMLSADGRRWTAAGVPLGDSDGVAALVIRGSDGEGNVGRTGAAFRLDAAAPRIRLLRSGAPLAGAADGATPPAGAQPVIFGQAISVSAQVDDGSTAAPPAAVMTLDGTPYTGALIEIEGVHLLVARATDCAAHAAAAHALLRIDRQGPALLSSDPADGARRESAVTTVSGVADTDLARATVVGRAATVDGDRFTVAPFPWREGRNEVAIELEDRAGNRASHSVAFEVRTAPLVVEIVESGVPLVSGMAFRRVVRPELRASGSSVALSATLDGAPFPSGSAVDRSGSFTLRAEAIDDWGRRAQAEASFTVDLGGGPEIEILSPVDGSVLESSSVRVSGTVSGDAPSISVNGVPAPVNAGAWAVADLELDPDATSEIVAVALDRSGRSARAAVSVRVASGGPRLLVLEPTDGASTNRATIDVAGVLVGGPDRSADGSVRVASPVGESTAAVAPDGSFRALDVPLMGGPNALVASATDGGGRSGIASVTVFADFTPPVIRLLERSGEPGSAEEPLVSGASFGGATVVVVEIGDDGAPLVPRIRLNGIERQDAALPRTEIVLATGGGYMLEVEARDSAGNEARAERAFLLDLGGCGLDDVSPAPGQAVESAAVTLVGRAASAVAVMVRVPQSGPPGLFTEYQAMLADGSFALADVPLPAVGTNRLELVCIDLAGRRTAREHAIERLAPGSGPEIEITTPGSGALVDGDAVSTAGTVSDGAVTVNGVAAAVTPSAGVNTFGAVAVPLAEGPNPVLARAVDSTGRAAEDRVVVGRDTQAPRIVILRPDAGSHVGLDGEGRAVVDVAGVVDLDTEPNLRDVTVSSPQGSIAATVDPGTGVFIAVAVPLDAAAAPGAEQVVTATAVDSLGHVGRSEVEVVLETEGPAIRLAQPLDQERFAAGAPATVEVRGEAWGEPGTAVSINGVDLDPATLAWEPAGPGVPAERRRVAFTAAVAVPAADGPFAVIARATDLEGSWAQDRRLLIRDASPPRVVEMIPSDGAIDVDRNGLLLVLFSEPIRHSSLGAAQGLTLTRLAFGDAVAGTHSVAGQAVAFVPAVPLAAGEEYALRAGPGIVDVAGNPLAEPAEARFSAAGFAAAAPPVLDDLPAVVCAAEVSVAGSAAPGATLKVRDGALVFTGFADDTGRFAVVVPLSGDGFHRLAAWSVDGRTGERSGEAVAVVRLDCGSPSIVEARFDRESGVVSIAFSEPMDAATLALASAAGPGAAIAVLDAGDVEALHDGVVSAPSPALIEIALDGSPEAWWRDRPVRLRVGPPAADLEGNAMAAVFETVFFPGGGDVSGGFLSGEVYDDTTGRPFAGARVRLLDASAGLGDVSVAAAASDGRGRFVLTGSVPAGRYVLALEGGAEAPTTRVYRRLSLRPSSGLVPFDSRLTPLAAPAGLLDPADGGTVETNAGGVRFAAQPGVLPGVSALAAHLTVRSAQGLPDFLPLGWTPAVAIELRLLADGLELSEPEPWPAGGATLDVALPAWAVSELAAGAQLVAARYEPATGSWLALDEPVIESARAGVEVDRAGDFAFVLADRESATRPAAPTAAGDVLTGTALEDGALTPPPFEADLALDPPVVGPTGRSTARVVVRSADGTTVWPSGLAVQAYLEERLVLAAGGEIFEAPFSADLVLYHPRLSSGEQGSAAPGAAGAMEFAVSPSARAAEVLLEVGWENIRVFPFPERVERGPSVGPDGGAVTTPEGVELVVPEGALAAQVPVDAAVLGADDLAALPAIAGFETLAGIRIDLSGATLARPATLSLPAPAGTPVDSVEAPRTILAEWVESPGDGRGAFARLVSRVRRAGAGVATRLVAEPEAEGSALPLDGVAREGLYLVLAADQPVGFATGFVRLAGGGQAPLELGRVTAGDLGTADLSRQTGRYAVPVSAGADRTLAARHPSLDGSGETSIATLKPGETVSRDLVVSPAGPLVVSLSPNDGTNNQPVGSSVSVLFSEALDPATVTASSLTLEWLDDAGLPTGVFAAGSVSLQDSRRIVFLPDRPLAPSRRYRARFAGAVADAGGAIYTGGPVVWSFRTAGGVGAGGQVHPEKFHVRVPADGVAEIFGEPGALPGSVAGEAPWAVTPEIQGPVADPVRDTFQGRADGSFDGTVGHLPAFAVTLDSRIWVKVFDPSGDLAAEFRVAPFTTADGLGFVAPAHEAVSFRSAEGLLVDVPAAAFAKATLVRIRSLPATAAAVGVATPEGLGLGAFVDLDFEGEAAETLRVHVPAPATAQDGAQVFIGRPLDLPWGRRLRTLSAGGVMERSGERWLSNDPSVQPEPPAVASALVVEAAEASGRTCRTARQEGLPRCFLQSILQEFTLRSQAVFYYEQGVEWTLLTGLAQPFPLLLGIAQEAIFNSLADAWVYLPTPHDWGGGFALPVVSSEPLEIARRDVATGWDLGRHSLDPPGGSDDLVDVGGIGNGQARRPVLLDAWPFEVARFAAPEVEESLRLALEIEAHTDTAGRVELQGVTGFELDPGTTVAIYDLVPEPPLAGPARTVCEPDEAWTSGPLAASAEMVMVVGRGGLDAATLDRFELQFDQPLLDVTGRPVDEVAKLLDLGALAEGCGASTEPGYPRALPLTIDQIDRASRLVLTPTSSLASGHRFRLEITPSEIAVEAGDGTRLEYWPSAPARFEFATRRVVGEPIAGSPPGPALGATSVARDLLKLGNLLIVASETGDLVAIDVSRASDPDGLRRHALENRGLRSAVRALATDGHNRIFYAGQFGSLWAIKTMRLEDIREAGAPCVEAPEWAAGLPCFEGVAGSVQVAYTLGSISGSTASEWLAYGAMPEATPMDLAVLAQDERGEVLEAEAFAESFGTSLGAADGGGIYTFDVPVRSSLARTQSPAPWRSGNCEDEPAHDRYQRVTVENLTTGESWSVDVENVWPGGGGDGSGLVQGVRARRGDDLRVRYNLRAIGHVALLGSGVTVVDLNRFYHLPHPAPTPQQRAGGGQCGRRLGKFEGQQVVFPDACAPALGGIGLTTAIATDAGGPMIDVYSPLSQVGALHSRSTLDRPGGVESDSLGAVGEALQVADLAACIVEVDGQRALLRDVALADDLLFLSLGAPGIYVYDITDRSLSNRVGRFAVPGHNVYRLQVDRVRELLFAGGTDDQGEPFIDVWSLRSVTESEALPLATLHAAWTTNNLGLDDSGSGLIFSWDKEQGPQAVPFDRSRFLFAGVDGSRFVPLGIPADASDDATAAFKLRAALPGSLGEELQVRVQSLRVLPSERMLGEEDVGAAVLPPGGPEWPIQEIVVRLRRLGPGVLANSHSLYESVETVLLIADPRARAGYVRRDEPGTEADEKGQCRRCERPSLSGEVKDLLAGRWVRAFLDGDGPGPTAAALAFFDGQADNYPAPIGEIELTGWSDEVPSPRQIGLDEPGMNEATWGPGEMGITVSLVSGELLFEAVDHLLRGRSMPFVLARSYRSGLLGYGPLGAAGWTSPLFAHMRELPTGEVEVHDGAGRAWRFLTKPVPGYEPDEAGNYYVPQGVHLRLQKLPNGQGFRLVGREHGTMLFDGSGRLVEIADRFALGGSGGSRMRLSYDAFGQLVVVEDDLGRRYRFEYDEDARSPRYGLLIKVVDFVGREIGYEYDSERRLVKVLLPEVENPVEEYSSFSFTGASRPTVEYGYGDRLETIRIPDFLGQGANRPPRARFGYDATGRATSVGFPDSADWTLSYAKPKVTVRSPWGHEIEHTLEDGRTTQLKEELLVHHPSEAPSVERLTTTFEYAEDGRVLSLTRPDNSKVTRTYADTGDRLGKANVIETITEALTQEAKGSADYESISETGAYDLNNQLTSLRDGENRLIDLAVPQAGQSDTSRFAAEQITSHFNYDSYGRVAEQRGGGAGGPLVRLGYGADARGRPGAGLVSRIERGSAFSHSLFYDPAFNVNRVETSQGTASTTEHDSWDRPVREVSGLSEDGRFASVGSCAQGEGAIAERAFDAAGHVTRERRLQDYVDPEDGETRCRFVESRFTYDAREQLVSVEESHRASASEPGEVMTAPQVVSALEYDEHGRLQRERARTLSRPDLITTYGYDAAGRVLTVKRGDEGARRVGYDERSRVVLATDGDEGVWRGRYDAWGRLYHEEPPTGAVVRRRFDKASNPLQESIFDADPTTTPTAKLLRDMRTELTSFGSVARVVEALNDTENRVTERVYDQSGRLTEVWTGPALAEDASRVDRTRGRREVQVEYEGESGRIAVERFGGDATTPPLHARKYLYKAENSAPWPDRVINLESVPGQAELVETTTTAFQRDALGRPIEQKRNDGSILLHSYDRTGGEIRTRTGAGAETAASLDARSLPIQIRRPNGRGATSYTHDLDGSVLREVTQTETDPWETTHAYDASGRRVRTNYGDGSAEILTYNSDSTLASRATRDGLLATYRYDAANRLEQVTPSLAPGGVTATLIDSGDSFAYDSLSRPTLLQHAGNPALSVRYTAYDMGSRPSSELVGTRAPLTWSYDAWDRPSQTSLPAGAGSDPESPFTGWRRTYDTLNRVTGLSGLGAAGLSSTPIGATWSWGGVDRLYAMTTKGALKTAARYGYHGGAGPQVPGLEPDAASKWKLATLAWGSAGSASAITAPQNLWGSFGFGWRGHEGEPQDGAKVGRQVLPAGTEAFASLGWSWEYDASVRLSHATLWSGDLTGQGPSGSEGTDSFRYHYGAGDEMERMTREVTGEITELETGKYGRIASKNGVAFAYDGAGRRTEDDRFYFQWDWRGQLVRVTVKDTWPAPEITPYAGHQVRYEYDAHGRLTHRIHYEAVPAGSSDDSQRPFVERRVFVWERDGLAAEAAYGGELETTLRWRKTYVPGPSGLDDAVQVIVQDALGTSATYTYLRDELGSVIGIVAEDESGDPANPAILARYGYSPYGAGWFDEAPLEGTAGVAVYESWSAAANTLGGRFPGGQNLLFQGAWTDPVAGLAYHRARWYDSRAAAWLSEDPLLDVDSSNLYAFVSHQPNMAEDPEGLALYAFEGTGADRAKMRNASNVSKLFDNYTRQRFIREGVGSDLWTALHGGLYGLGGRLRLEWMYAKLVKAYNAGDRDIDIIGFSRGAALGRAFANLINERGIPDLSSARTEYEVTERGYRKRTVYGHYFEKPEIRFLGLFDTVGSFGIPGNPVDLGYDLSIPPNVRAVRQATALGEYRLLFPLASVMSGPGAACTQRICERGFEGAHTDIGGGYEDNDEFAEAALRWMWSEGRGLGVPFGYLDPEDLMTESPLRHDSRMLLDQVLESAVRFYGGEYRRQIYYYPQRQE